MSKEKEYGEKTWLFFYWLFDWPKLQLVFQPFCPPFPLSVCHLPVWCTAVPPLGSLKAEGIGSDNLCFSTLQLKVHDNWDELDRSVNTSRKTKGLHWNSLIGSSAINTCLLLDPPIEWTRSLWPLEALQPLIIVLLFLTDFEPLHWTHISQTFIVLRIELSKQHYVIIKTNWAYLLLICKSQTIFPDLGVLDRFSSEQVKYKTCHLWSRHYCLEKLIIFKWLSDYLSLFILNSNWFEWIHDMRWPLYLYQALSIAFSFKALPVVIQ